MRTMHITLIAGARPNFMKIAPLIKAIKEWNELTNERLTNKRSSIQYRLVHTGQHYDKNTLSFEKISQNNFQELLEYIKKEVLLEEPNSDLPMDVGDAPRGTTIIQNGNNCVAATISNGGAMTINM